MMLTVPIYAGAEPDLRRLNDWIAAVSGWMPEAADHEDLMRACGHLLTIAQDVHELREVPARNEEDHRRSVSRIWRSLEKNIMPGRMHSFTAQIVVNFSDARPPLARIQTRAMRSFAMLDCRRECAPLSLRPLFYSLPDEPLRFVTGETVAAAQWQTERFAQANEPEAASIRWRPTLAGPHDSRDPAHSDDPPHTMMSENEFAEMIRPLYGRFPLTFETDPDEDQF